MLEIRRYRPSDYDAVWELHNVALHAVNAHAGNGPWDDDLHQIERVYLANDGEFLVGILNGQLVAMGALRQTTPGCAEIKRMRVSPAYQRRGFGQAMLIALEGRAVELGCSIVHLDTTVQQEAARRLYEKNGFSEVHRTVVGGWECIFYEKSLAH